MNLLGLGNIGGLDQLNWPGLEKSIIVRKFEFFIFNRPKGSLIGLQLQVCKYIVLSNFTSSFLFSLVIQNTLAHMHFDLENTFGYKSVEK